MESDRSIIIKYPPTEIGSVQSHDWWGVLESRPGFPRGGVEAQREAEQALQEFRQSREPQVSSPTDQLPPEMSSEE